MKKQPKRKLTPKQKKQQRIFFGVLIGIVIIALIIHFRRKQANPTEIQSEIARHPIAFLRQLHRNILLRVCVFLEIQPH